MLSATAAFAQQDLIAEVKRAAEAVSLSTSEAPAVRQERAVREPSPGFMLGAAYRAWVNAATQLDFDLANPTAAGPAHASQNGALSDFILDECREEGTAYANLDSRSRALDLTPQRVAEMLAAPPADMGLLTRRKTGAASVCR